MCDPTASGNPLDDIIAEYIQAAEAGRVPSRQALLDVHPGFADELRAFFADYDRLDNRAEALKLGMHRPLAERPKVRYLGDFELLEEIAEGGMGLVFKARQETLGRIVALKLVRAGRLAKPIDIARFRIEAEAAAGLDHPNIVPLYEVGEQDGQHYLAMKFIDGPSLAKLPRGPIKTEVQRLEAVARAVDFAHRQGILHRDIKPSNILTDTASTPYVTDFGLAKRIDAELSLTESGQMLGTAGYVAPEQALGKKGLTVTADVFSLGAVLFERLTGTPAFPGGTILERLRSLHESITPRPTVLMPQLPRDLETVCLKALEREPGKRYATAGAFADDLARWLRGEPIVARRVTQLERFWLWCRRNPAVAAWAGTAITAIGVGAIFSSVQLAKATRATIAAKDAEQERINAKCDAEEYFALAKRGRAEFANSLIQTVGIRTKQNETLPSERWAFFELAKRDDELKLLFLQLALSDGILAEKLAISGENVVQVTIGPSLSRRKKAVELAAAALKDPKADERVRFSAAMLALCLGADDIPLPGFLGDRWLAPGTECPWAVDVDSLAPRRITQLAPTWLELLERSQNSGVADWAVRGIDRACEVSGDETRAGLATDIIVAVMNRGAHGEPLRTTDAQRLVTLAAQRLTTLAARLDAPSAQRAAVALIADMKKAAPKDETVVAIAEAAGLTALAPRLNQAGAAEAIGALNGILVGNVDTRLQTAGELALAALTRRLHPQTAAQDWVHFINHLGQGLHPDALAVADETLAIIAQRLDQSSIATACDALLNTLGSASDEYVLRAATQGLVALAGRLDRTSAARVFDALAALPSRTNNWRARMAAGRALAALSPSLGQVASDKAFAVLFGLLDQLDVNHPARQTIAAACADLAPRLGPVAALGAWNSRIAVVTALGKNTNLASFPAELAQALSVRLAGPDVRRAFDVVLPAVIKAARANEWNNVTAFGPALTALARQVDSAAMHGAIDGLLTAITEATNTDQWDGIDALVPIVAALAPRVDSATARRAFDVLVPCVALAADAHAKEDPIVPTERPFVKVITPTLEALAPRLDSATARRGLHAVLAVMQRHTNQETSEGTCSAALALAAQMDPAEQQDGKQLVGTTAVGFLKRLRDANRMANEWENLCFTIDALELRIQRSIASGEVGFGGVVKIVTYGEEFVGAEVQVPIISSVKDLPTIADCLRHPACVGRTRQLVLHRLEELAFPPSDADKQQALAESVVTGLAQPLADGVLAAGRQAKWERELKFRTTWDAVEWLHENHREIDLDKPYTPRK